MRTQKWNKLYFKNQELFNKERPKKNGKFKLPVPEEIIIAKNPKINSILAPHDLLVYLKVKKACFYTINELLSTFYKKREIETSRFQ